MATTEAEIETKLESGVEPEFPPYLMPLELYERLIQSGVFGAKDKFFLWRGRLVEKLAPRQPHVFAVSFLTRNLLRILPESWYLLQEQPVSIGDNSLPEPDISIIRGSLSDYLKHRATETDVALIIEVADSSVYLDSKPVLRAYAAAGIPVYWIINIPNCRIEVYSDPTGPSESPSYRKRDEYGPDAEVPVVLDGLEVGRVAARDVLPSP